MIINDDLGAFTFSPRPWGRSASPPLRPSFIRIPAAERSERPHRTAFFRPGLQERRCRFPRAFRVERGFVFPYFSQMLTSHIWRKEFEISAFFEAAKTINQFRQKSEEREQMREKLQADRRSFSQNSRIEAAKRQLYANHHSTGDSSAKTAGLSSHLIITSSAVSTVMLVQVSKPILSYSLIAGFERCTDNETWR